MRALLLVLAACVSLPEPLSNRGGTQGATADAPRRLVCAWLFDWLGVVQVGGGECAP